MSTLGGDHQVRQKSTIGDRKVLKSEPAYHIGTDARGIGILQREEDVEIFGAWVVLVCRCQHPNPVVDRLQLVCLWIGKERRTGQGRE